MSDANFKLDTARKQPALEYLTWMHQASEAGKSIGSMLKELVKLQFSKAKISPEEYFLYQLYDDERYTWEAKQTFMGSGAKRINSPWAIVCHDKPTFTALLQGLGLPTPETQAFVHPERSIGNAYNLRDGDDVRRFLREDAKYPIFGKPMDSVCSLGSANISDFDHAEDAIILSDGRHVDVDRLIEQIRQFDFKYLFQSLLLPHEDLIPIIGNRVSTVRMYVLQDDDGCELLRASWKIPGSTNGADNFWRPGNILAGIDVKTGKLGRTLQRTEKGTQPIDKHPVTDTEFADLVFPHWDKMVETVMRAAPNLSGCHFQGWDVALTDLGPVLVECEGDGGDTIMEQLCFDTGLLQGRFLEFFESRKEREQRDAKKRKARWRQNMKRNMAALKVQEKSAAAEEANQESETAKEQPVKEQAPAANAETKQEASEATSV